MNSLLKIYPTELENVLDFKEGFSEIETFSLYKGKKTNNMVDSVECYFKVFKCERKYTESTRLLIFYF